MSFDSASVPKFDPRMRFQDWHRQWMNFCIGKRWENLYAAGANGVYAMPVISDSGETGVRNNEVRDSDRKIVRSALLCAFDEVLCEAYDNDEVFRSALSIVEDLRRRFDKGSKFRAQKIFVEMLQVECRDINQLQDYFVSFSRSVTQIRTAGGQFTLDTDTEIFLLTHGIKIEALKELVENIKETDGMTASKAIEMLTARAESVQGTVGSSGSSAMYVKSKFFRGICHNCGIFGHRADDCRKPKRKQYVKRDWKQDERDGNSSSTEGSTEAQTSQNAAKKVSMVSIAKDSGSTSMSQLTSDIWNLNSISNLVLNNKTTDDSVYPSCAIKHLSLMALANHTSPACADQLRDDDWAIDTGATDFFCHNKFLLSDLKEKSSSVVTASGEKCKSSMIGTANLKTHHCELELKNVTYVPEFSLNLFSLLRALDSGHYATFYPDECTVRKIETNEIVLTAHRHECGLFIVDQIRDSTSPGLKQQRCAAYSVWHSRLGHPGQEKLKLFLKYHQLNCDDDKNCEDCLLGKSTKSTFRSVMRNALVPLELLHMDLVGPLPCSVRANNYFLMVVDDNSRYIWLIPLATKAEAKERIIELIQNLERQYELNVKRVRTDRGGEFVNNELKRFFVENGIEHETSAPYTPQQNGRAERANRTILTVMRTIMSESGVPKELWDYAAQTATYLVNRWPKKTGSSPYEVLNRRKPLIDNLHPFGCLAVVNTRKDARDKVDPPGKSGVFIGYTLSPRNFLIYDLESKKVTESPNVRFVENSFPFRQAH